MTLRSEWITKFYSWCKKPSSLFIFISIPSVIYFANIVPVAWGLDEQFHIARSYQVSTGNMYPDKLDIEHEFGGELPITLIDSIMHGWSEANFTANKLIPFYSKERIDVKDRQKAEVINSRSINEPSLSTYSFGTTGPYAPFTYMPSSIGFIISRALDLSVGQSVILSRIIQALTFVLLAYLALRVLDSYRIAWLVWIVALLPATVFLASVINADAVTNGVILLFLAVTWRVYYRVFNGGDIARNDSILLLATSLLLASVKPAYSLLYLLLLPILKHLWRIYKFKLLIVGLGVLLMLMIITVLSLGYSDAGLIYHADNVELSLIGQLVFILTHPLEFIGVLVLTLKESGYQWFLSLTGLMGYNAVHPPVLILTLNIITVVLAAINTEFISKKYSWLMFSVGIMLISAVIVILYCTFNPIGASSIAGVQGRYFLPALIPLVIGLTGILGIDKYLSQRVVVVLFVLITTISLLVATLAYRMALV